MAELSYMNIGVSNGMASESDVNCRLEERCQADGSHQEQSISESPTTFIQDVSSPSKSSEPSEAGIVVGEIIIPEAGNVFVETFAQNGRSFEVSGEFGRTDPRQHSTVVICEDSSLFSSGIDGSALSAALEASQVVQNHEYTTLGTVAHSFQSVESNISQSPSTITTLTPMETSPVPHDSCIQLHKPLSDVLQVPTSQPNMTENEMESQASAAAFNDSMSFCNSSTPLKPYYKPTRNKLLTSQLLSPDEIVREVIEQAERKRPPQIPEGGDLLFQKQLTQRLANKVVKEELLARASPISYPPPKKPCADAEALRLLSILEDNEGQEKVKEKEKVSKEKEGRNRGRRGPPRPPIDRQLERELALKQLMEVSRKRIRKPESNNNEEKDKEKEKEKCSKKMKPELKRLLQDEGAINMLYDLEHGDKVPPPGRRPTKKTLHRKAQEVEQALLESPGRRKPRLRKSQKAQASKIVRRHSSSSSYSSRGSSPSRRSSADELTESPSSEIQSASCQTSTTPATATLSDASNLENQGMPSQLPDSNGFKEKLQNEFSNKFKSVMVKKAILSVKREQKGIEPLIHPVAKSPQIPSMSPRGSSKVSDSVWQMLQDDWQLEEDQSTPQPSSVNTCIPNPEHGSAPPTTVAITNHTPVLLPPPNNIKTEIAPLPAAEPHGDSFTNINDISFTHRLGNFEYKELLIRQIGPLIHIKIAPVSTFLPQALNVRVLRELTRAIDEVGASWSGCRVLLLTSSTNVFSAGVDLPALLSDDSLVRATSARELAQAVKDFIFKIGMLQKPVIAGVEGRCIGLGMSFLAFCDLIYATSAASFYLPHHILGYSPEGAATLSLPIVIGFRQMVNMIIMGERLGAEKARECGFVTEVLPEEDFTVNVVARAYDLAVRCPEIMETFKGQYMSEIRSKLSATLTVETNRLQLQWPTGYCQMQIKEHAELLLAE